ncbi:porin [Azoarcus sp. L1K30]|uniref:porin n=1 Tax=Azoarcus sp. L1K30 TaxID=2820277 RepID=UPI001B842802|nr:porin [Azoarcus sp. L1K30]MBR0565452.1 porin [Azoarcus sp. L1K30]
MKYTRTVIKTLLAGLLTGAMTAGAHADSVQVYGLVGLYVGSIKHSGDTESTRALNGGGLQTSFIGVKGSEDLGGGLKALFALESFFRPDTGEQGRSSADPLLSRNGWVGIEGAFGRVSAGRQTNPTYAVMSQLSPFGASVVFSPLTVQSFIPSYGRNVLGDSVWNNVVKYATPNLGGLRGSVLYGFGETGGGAGSGNTGIHATYRAGKFMGAISVQRVRMQASTRLVDPQRAWLAGATYDFGVATIYANTIRTSIDNGNKTRLYDLGMSVPISRPGKLMLEAAQTRTDLKQAADHRRTTVSFGYDHRLSKRTDVFAIYSYDKRTDKNLGNTIAAGIRHLF